MKNSRSFPLSLPAIFLLLFSCLPPCHATAEQTEIESRYSQARGKQIKWQVTIPNPAPVAVIVIQTIPRGTTILTSQPDYNNFNPVTGTIKWLLSNVQPGIINMSIELDRPILRKGEIHGKIIFQDNSSHPMAEAFITRKNRKKSIEGC